MNSVTYYARFSHCYSEENGNHICVYFPDVSHACTDGGTMTEAIDRAKDILLTELDLEDDLTPDIYPPSSLDELVAEANSVDYWYGDDLPDGYERRYEFVPITVTPTTDTYMRCMKPHKRLKLS